MDTVDLQVALLPALLDPASLVGRTVVVVDVLRATTTITAALSQGARCVIPCPSIEAALETHRRLGPDSVLGGERGGRKIDGFHCGNSPREYNPENIADKTLILATTNGTVAMERCRLAEKILIGAFANLDALAQRLNHETRLTILCSGTDQQITSEDILFAGALCDRMQQSANEFGRQVVTGDSAEIAHSYWLRVCEQIKSTNKTLFDFVAESLGGRNLAHNGYIEDIRFCAKLNSFDQVAQLDAAAWKIKLS